MEKYANIPSSELEEKLENDEIPEDDILLVCFLLEQRKDFAGIKELIDLKT